VIDEIEFMCQNMSADACLLLVVPNPNYAKSCIACISLDLNHAPVYVFWNSELVILV
jgi:hypothetical protein